MKFLSDYTIILRPDDNGTFIAYIPAIKGCHAWGKTLEKARSELNNVFEMIHEEYLATGETLPNDVEVTVSHASSSKNPRKSC
ncbi:MAG TPA: type II toxin-antitoxin system HicB family antitoxin [Cyanothece sp. UBA12306]|nr:type II toxin-antitoxin system HicB family antitoxin [Cyanothece sp. UBA12306]